MKRKQNTKGLARGRVSAKKARGGRTAGSKARMSSGRAKMGAKSTSRSRSAVSAKPRAKGAARSSAKSRTSLRSSRTGASARNKRSTAGRGLVKAMTRIKGKSAQRSTSESPAKRSTRKASGSVNTRRVSNGMSGARRASAKQPIGTSRRVNASTKPSFGQVEISDIQRSSVDERISPQADKPYTGADAFKPDAKGADTLMSAPPRKPIRQSRNQVGLRHH